MVPFIPILFLFVSFAIRIIIASSCFRRDGTVDSSAVPCDNAPGIVSACCIIGSGVKCLPNGVCQRNSTTSSGSQDPDPLHASYWIDACTDSTWSSPVCLSQCLSPVSSRNKPMNYLFSISRLCQSS
jgi:hypothetical protein